MVSFISVGKYRTMFALNSQYNGHGNCVNGNPLKSGYNLTSRLMT